MFPPRRRISREVRAGRLIIGGSHPVRIQSMTNTDPMDTAATAEQILSLAEAGAEMVRLTVPSIKVARNLARIRQYLESRGAAIPLVADIHFNPAVALAASEFVHKIRINPGNFADPGNKKDCREPTLPAPVRDAFLALIDRLRSGGLALRIGVNHGSLSSRILSLYGNTVHAMVVSALEFLQIAEQAGYFNIVFSMKSSIPQVMIRAYRELILEMDRSGRNYPIHLGVTEAGEGIAGRLKSAVGIGPLLLDGIGDTLRVSLSEPPQDEIPVCRDILSRLKTSPGSFPLPSPDGKPPPDEGNLPFPEPIIPGLEDRRFPLAGLYRQKDSRPSPLPPPRKQGERFDGVPLEERTADFIFRESALSRDSLPPSPSFLVGHSDTPALLETGIRELEIRGTNLSPMPRFFEVCMETLHDSKLDCLPDVPAVLILSLPEGRTHEILSKKLPLLKRKRPKDPLIALYHASLPPDTWFLWAAMDLGLFLMDRCFAGLVLAHPEIDPDRLLEITFELLQATRQRMTRAEYITCPTCGRTRFDLPRVLYRVREATRHLTGLKIAVMGCMVNGPGEMADADYGYVGNAPGRVTLFRGPEIIARNLPHEKAVEHLVALIKQDGKWIDPPQNRK